MMLATPHPRRRLLWLTERRSWSNFTHARFGSRAPSSDVLSVMGGRSIYKLTWKAIVAFYD
jgi:hypothetical protein